MNPILQPVDDLLNNQEQAIVLLKAQLDALNAVTVYDHLEQTPWKIAPGTTANTGTTGSIMTASQAQPGVNSAWLGIQPHGPWADGYFYKTLPIPATKNTFSFELFLLFGTPADAGASNCIELDIMQVANKVAYNPAFQFNFGSNILRVWDRPLSSWVSIGLPCPRWTSGQWTHVLFEAHKDAKTVYHDAITINGMRHALNMNFTVTPIDWNDIFNVAIQLDGDKAGSAYQVYVDAVRFSAS